MPRRRRRARRDTKPEIPLMDMHAVMSVFWMASFRMYIDPTLPLGDVERYLGDQRSEFQA